MFPVGDVIPPRRAPVVTMALLALSAVASLAGTWLVPASTAPAAWLALSPILHAGWVHLAGNALSVWIFGATIEDVLGRAAYLAFYALTALIGLGVSLLTPDPLPPGGSAPAAAIIGAYFVLYPRSRVLVVVFLVLARTVVEIPALYVLGTWVVVQAVALLSPAGMPPVSVAVFAPHAAALACGALVGVRLRRRVRWD